MSLLPEDPAPMALPDARKPLGMTGKGPGTYQVELRGGTTVGRQVVKS
jgi:hypothetical protein